MHHIIVVLIKADKKAKISVKTVVKPSFLRMILKRKKNVKIILMRDKELCLCTRMRQLIVLSSVK
jgi:hypothetical protein